MKQLHDKVNIVPVIGKADTLTPTELNSMKRRVGSRSSKFRDNKWSTANITITSTLYLLVGIVSRNDENKLCVNIEL